MSTDDTGSGYYDSEGDYIPGPNDFDREDDFPEDEDPFDFDDPDPFYERLLT